MFYCVTKKYIEECIQLLEKQIPYEKKKAKEDMKNNNNLDNKYKRYQYPAYFFLFEVCILFFFLFSIVQFTSLLPKFIETLSGITNPTKVSNLPYPVFSMIDKQNDLIKESWEKWYQYFYLQNTSSLAKIDERFINEGNASRPFWNFFITNIFPTIILGYIIWVIIKYYKYVFAAMWGFFIMLYSFFTKKVECTLAAKWYIRMVTGWKKCKVSFSDYLNRWYNDFILRPIKEQHINYRKAYDSINSPNSFAWISINIVLTNILKLLDVVVSYLQSISLLFNNIFSGIKMFFDSVFTSIKEFLISIGLMSSNKDIDPDTDDIDNCQENEQSHFQDNTCKENIYFDILVLILLITILYNLFYETTFIQSIVTTLSDLFTKVDEKTKSIIIVGFSSILAITFYLITFI